MGSNAPQKSPINPPLFFLMAFFLTTGAGVDSVFVNTNSSPDPFLFLRRLHPKNDLREEVEKNDLLEEVELTLLPDKLLDRLKDFTFFNMLLPASLRDLILFDDF